MKSLSVRLGVILIGLLIFGYGKVCKAGCAWVFWEKTCKFTAKTGENMKCVWELQDAYPTYEQCTKVRANAWTGYKKEFPKSDGVPSGYIILNKESEEAVSVHLYCFPDTIDPRK